MTDLTKKLSSGRKTKIIVEAICLLLALMTFVSLFLPVIRHQKPTNFEVGLGDFGVSAIASGGLYDNKSDEIDPETYVYVKYSKLSLDAQNYYTYFVLLDEGNAGKVFAVFLLLAEICGVLLLLSALLALLADFNTYLIQIILGVLQVAFAVAMMLCVPKLSSLVQNTEFPSLNFVVVLRPAVYFILASGAGFTLCSALGWVLSLKRKQKG